MEGGCNRRRGGGQPREKRGGGGSQEWGKRGRVATRVSLREKRNDASDDSDLASNGPKSFSHIHAPKINLWQRFLGILQGNSSPSPSMR
jgi:hypothetical protein